MLGQYLDKIIYGDALEIIPQLPNESIDLCLTDPPYLGRKPAVITRKGGKFGYTTDIHKGLYSKNLDKISFQTWIPLVYPKLKKNGILITFVDKREISYLIDYLESELDMTLRNIVVWHKTNPVPQARKVKWMDSWEAIVIATKNKGTGHHYNWRMGQHHDLIETPICMGKERVNGGFHPTQKPIKLIEPLVKWWSYEGDIILDPFCGSGTTCVVAKMLNRHYIGIEINKEYVEIARKRLSEVQNTKISRFLK